MRLELKFFMVWLIFSTIFLTLSSIFFPNLETTNLDEEAIINELTINSVGSQELGFWDGFSYAILGDFSQDNSFSFTLFGKILNSIFDIMGIEFILFIEGMPNWFLTLYSLWSLVSIFMGIFYLVDIIWIG